MRCGIAVLSLLSAVPAAWGHELTLVSVKDNTLYATGATQLSNGAGSRMFAGITSTNLTRRALLAFDLSQVPHGSTIHDARLELNMSMSISPDVPVSLHRVLADWGEGTSFAPMGQGGGAPATPGDATWLHRTYPSPQWTTPGGDFSPTPSATTQVGFNGLYLWSDNAMVADVQHWVDNPSQNFGWLVFGDESTTSTAKSFDTHEHVDPNARPRLVIDYTPPVQCYPDCNNDMILNLGDFGCFQTKFALQDPYADCNGDLILNLGDFGCFQTRFALGCP